MKTVLSQIESGWGNSFSYSLFTEYTHVNVCYVFDVCSGGWQTSRRTTVWRNDWRHCCAVLGSTDKRRRQARHRLRCRETWAWFRNMDKVCATVKYIHITCRYLFVCSPFSSACSLLITAERPSGIFPRRCCFTYISVPRSSSRTVTKSKLFY